MLMTVKRLLFIALWLGLLSACTLLTEEIDMTAGWSAERFYREGQEELQGGNYLTAIERFEKLQTRYPFGRYAQQAQLHLIYAYYKSEQPESAIAAADRFIRTNPRHPDVDYAYYMKGVVNFNRGVGVIERLLPGDPAKTDTLTASQAFNDFSELVRRFPQSRYAEDAAQRMVYLRNNLARYELNVGDYYLRREAYVAAANRAKYVLENYANSPVANDALAMLARAYLEMDMEDLARDALRVLRLNNPDHPELAGLQSWLAGGDRPRPTSPSLFSLF
ncbi:MAG: outer membrane protein assembly factor BamD [Candidatus Competibacteraceae bacterium]|nr:outer membrane protein assembly factor BamD [Candidatus Competibacteraceae bacterium]